MDKDQKNIECLKAYLALNYNIVKESEKQIKDQPECALQFQFTRDLAQKPIDFILKNSDLTLEDAKNFDQRLLDKYSIK